MHHPLRHKDPPEHCCNAAHDPPGGETKWPPPKVRSVKTLTVYEPMLRRVIARRVFTGSASLTLCIHSGRADAQIRCTSGTLISRRALIIEFAASLAGIND